MWHAECMIEIFMGKGWWIDGGGGVAVKDAWGGVVRVIKGSLQKHLKTGGGAQGGTLQLKKREGWLDSLGSEILVGKDILMFLKNIDLDKS